MGCVRSTEQTASPVYLIADRLPRNAFNIYIIHILYEEQIYIDIRIFFVQNQSWILIYKIYFTLTSYQRKNWDVS